MPDWFGIAVQAGGAVAVCAMFLWHLERTKKADDKARKEFLEHLESKDVLAQDYLKERDALSRETAMNGHRALQEVASQVAMLREEIKRQI